MANKRKSRSGAVMGIAVLIVLLLVLNVAASRMSATIAMGIGRFTSDALNEDTDYTVESNYLDGFEASVDIMSEGTVLLKNDVIDGGRTGLSSVVASIGFIAAMFTWAFFALMATYTATVSDYGHATSNSYAEYALAVFAIADGVMLFVGIMMMKGMGGIDAGRLDEIIPFAATVAGIALTQNIVYGVAAGMILWVVLKLFSFKLEEIKSIGVPSASLTAVLIAVLCLI